jgi:signal transduction histidine kinase
VISRSIVLDVTRLADAVRKVGRGDLGLRTEPGNLPETRELAMAFNTMLDSLAGHREALVKANQEMARHQALAELGKFSLMIAHEVKNPLGIIKISFDFLKRDLEIPQDNAMVEYIEDEIVRLNGLIEEFLLFARPAKPTFRPVDLNGMAKEMIDRVALQNTESDVVLETDLPQSLCEIFADPDLLTRALGNIVKNAYEANDGKGVVSISARLEKGEWVLEVSDDGPGIPQENLEQVFEPFFTTKSKGTGLGLAFSKQILIAHRGTITARNRERGGATFEARIPIERGG